MSSRYVVNTVRFNASHSAVIEMLDDGSVIVRAYEDGRLDASYTALPIDAALKVAADVIRGLEPPRGLYRRDTPADQTRPEDEWGRVV